MKITIVGAGGIGSSIAESVARVLEYGIPGAHSITIIDGDSIEWKNLARQKFSVIDVGSFKSSTLAGELVNKGFEKITFQAVEEYLNNKNVEELIEEGSIVLSCVDNHKTRGILNNWVKNMQDCVLISGGNEFETGNVQMYVRSMGQNITGNLFENHPEIEQPPDGDLHPDELSCGENIIRGGEKAEQTIRANIFAATIMLNMMGEALSWMSNKSFNGTLTQEAVFNINGASERIVVKKLEAINGPA